ncbi:MAG: AMP-binding protein [Acidobacteria bacterium]|nr:AMP-binding protein [Acidobacteriota bacterium]MCA1639653.1 AMP-binding protein [Acidobacteriota bacterium]
MTASESDTIEKFSHKENEYPPPRIVAENALLKDAKAEYERWRENPDAFWAAEAEKFVWLKKWDKVSSFDGVNHEWFVGGKINITLNMLDRHANLDKRDKIAYIWLGENGEERKVSYRELLESVCRFANGLKSLNVKKGDRVIIYMPLTIEGVVAMLACARIGAIHSVVYAGLGQAALRDRIVDADAKIVVAGDVGFRRGKTIDLKSIVDEAVKDFPSVEKVVLFRRSTETPTNNSTLAAEPDEISHGSLEYLDSDKNESAIGERDSFVDADILDREIDFADLMKFPAKCEAEAMDAEDILFILYTSGTTGLPKGVVHCHQIQERLIDSAKTVLQLEPDDFFWCSADAGWVTGLCYGIFAPWLLGFPILIYEGEFDVHRWLDILERNQVTCFYTTPTLLRLLRNEVGDISKHRNFALRRVYSVGELLNPEVIKWAERTFDARVFDNYWQTETGSFIIANRPNMLVKRGAMGKAVEGVQVSIIDNSGREVPNGVVGDIAIRPTLTSLFKGCWNFPEATRAWFRAGWYITRDRGKRDADDYFWFMARNDNVIMCQAQRIGPFEVENALLSHPAIAESAAVGAKTK